MSGVRAEVVAGIFVGGESRRMGGRAKGWLLAPPDAQSVQGRRPSIIERTLALARQHCEDVVLVGRADAYADLGIPAIADATTGGEGATPAPGPLAGLVALLERAGDRCAIAIACDMPYLTAGMLARLTSFAPDAAAVAPREPSEPALWSPLFARYDPRRVGRIARAKLELGARSLRVVLESVATRELPLSPEEARALRDWDAPEDIDDLGAERAHR